MNIWLANLFANRNQTERALKHHRRIAEADNFLVNWYTLESFGFMAEYYRHQNPELSRQYFQKIVDRNWNMGGLLDKAKNELSKN